MGRKKNRGGGRGGGRSTRGKKKDMYTSASPMTFYELQDDDDDDVGPAPDTRELAPASVAASLDTPTHSPVREPEEPSGGTTHKYSFNLLGKGPNLSEASDDDDDEDSKSSVMLPPTPVPQVHPRDDDDGSGSESESGASNVVKTESTAKRKGGRKRRPTESPVPHCSKRMSKSPSVSRETRSRTMVQRPGEWSECSSSRSSSCSSSCSSSNSGSGTDESDLSPSRPASPPSEMVLHPSKDIEFDDNYVPKTPMPVKGERGRRSESPQSLCEAPIPSPLPVDVMCPPTPRVPARSSPEPIFTTPSPLKAKRKRLTSPTPLGDTKKLSRYNPRKTARACQQGTIATRDALQVTDEDGPRIPGTIKILTVVNVMSHKVCTVEFSKTCNFIIGENGSGKSAILSAIVAGLGGKAYDTGRATSMRALIRNGQRNARIEITLHNDWNDLYGKDIKIVRSFNAEGNSRYQIRDVSGKLRSLPRHELNLVLSKFNIQVDNPLAILHQEMSKNFLRTRDPYDMYNYFYRALLLGPCEKLLKKADAALKTATHNLELQETVLRELTNEELLLEKKVKMVEMLRKSKDKLKRWEKEYQWALFDEQQQEYKKVKQEFEEAKKRLDEANEEKNKTSERVTEEENNLAYSEVMHQNVEEALIQGNSETENLKMQKRNLTFEYKTKKGSLKQIAAAVDDKQKNLASIQWKVNEHHKSVGSIYEQQMREREARKQDLQQRLAEKHGEEHDLLKQETELATKIDPSLAEERKLAKALAEKKKEIEKKRQDLGSCKNKKKTTGCDVFGKEILRLEQRIKTEKFNKPPRGPFGACFTVKDKKWAPLIEYIFSRYHDNLLASFLVDNETPEDAKKFTRLVEEIYNSRNASKYARKPSVTMTRFSDTKYNISRGKVHCDAHPTILDQIEVLNDDHVVFNWIVDLTRSERILLFENSDAACDMMQNYKNVPKNTQRGYTLDGYVFSPDPNYRAVVNNFSPTKYVLRYLNVTSDAESRYEKLQAEISMLERDCRELHQEYEDWAIRNREDKRQLAALSEEIRKCKISQSQIRSELEQLERSVIDAPDIDSLMDEIASLNQSIASDNQKAADFEEDLKNLETKLLEIETQLKTQTDRLTELESQKSTFVGQRKKMRQRIEELKKEFARKESVCNNLQRTLIELNKKDKEAKKALSSKREEIERKYPNRPAKLLGSSQEIKTKKETLTEQLKKNEKDLQNKEAILRDYENSKKNTSRMAQEINNLKDLLMIMAPIIKVNTGYFFNKRREFANSIRVAFKNLIKRRGYTGDLSINDVEQVLGCYVTLDGNTDKGKKTMARFNKKDVMDLASGMSGGERSFTTICFLTACWSVMDMPFYILDEFDVFMDSHNIKASMEILMSVLQEKDVQIVILTPLQIPVQTPEGSSVIRLNAPKRQIEGDAEVEAEDEDTRSNRRARVKSLALD